MSRYIIIGGTTKAGTFALYDYLSKHPQICASNYKETRFFLDASYPVNFKSVKNHEDGLHLYQDFFACLPKANKIYLEATPDYIYSTGTAARIHDFIQTGGHQVKLIFVLRNPIERFVSWFYFGKQLGDIPMEMTFKDFFEKNYQNTNLQNNALTALEKGRYSNYLKSFLNVFEKEDILILPYSSFRENPLTFLNNILEYTDIQPLFNPKDFKELTSNETYKVKNRSLFNLIRNVRAIKKRINSPFSKKIAKWAGPIWQGIIKKNTIKNDKSDIDSDTLKKVEEYYKNEQSNISKLLGRVFNW